MRWFSLIALGMSIVLASPHVALRYALLAMFTIHLLGNIYFWHRARRGA